MKTLNVKCQLCNNLVIFLYQRGVTNLELSPFGDKQFLAKKKSNWIVKPSSLKYQTIKQIVSIIPEIIKKGLYKKMTNNIMTTGDILSSQLIALTHDGYSQLNIVFFGYFSIPAQDTSHENLGCNNEKKKIFLPNEHATQGQNYPFENFRKLKLSQLNSQTIINNTIIQ